jgi:hypothetical protein
MSDMENVETSVREDDLRTRSTRSGYRHNQIIATHDAFTHKLRASFRNLQE